MPTYTPRCAWYVYILAVSPMNITYLRPLDEPLVGCLAPENTDRAETPEPAVTVNGRGHCTVQGGGVKGVTGSSTSENHVGVGDRAAFNIRTSTPPNLSTVVSTISLHLSSRETSPTTISTWGECWRQACCVSFRLPSDRATIISL